MYKHLSVKTGSLFLRNFYDGGLIAHYEVFIRSNPDSVKRRYACLFSLGNLLHELQITNAAHFSFFLGIVLFLLLLGKLVFATNSVVTEMQNPIIASVSPTFTMGTLALSSGLHYYGISSSIIHTLWILAAATQIFIICYFFITFIWKKKITVTDVFPSWLILFVGTAVMPLTAKDLSGGFYTRHCHFCLLCVFDCGTNRYFTWLYSQ